MISWRLRGRYSTGFLGVATGGVRGTEEDEEAIGVVVDLTGMGLDEDAVADGDAVTDEDAAGRGRDFEGVVGAACRADEAADEFWFSLVPFPAAFDFSPAALPEAEVPLKPADPVTDAPGLNSAAPGTKTDAPGVKVAAPGLNSVKVATVADTPVLADDPGLCPAAPRAGPVNAPTGVAVGEWERVVKDPWTTPLGVPPFWFARVRRAGVGEAGVCCGATTPFPPTPFCCPTTLDAPAAAKPFWRAFCCATTPLRAPNPFVIPDANATLPFPAAGAAEDAEPAEETPSTSFKLTRSTFLPTGTPQTGLFLSSSSIRNRSRSAASAAALSASACNNCCRFRSFWEICFGAGAGDAAKGEVAKTGGGPATPEAPGVPGVSGVLLDPPPGVEGPANFA